MSTRYFLARNQKTFGPLTSEEVEALRQSGQLAQYTWIFQEGDANWTPIDPPPALPSGVAAQPSVDTKRAHLNVVAEPPLYAASAAAHETPRPTPIARRLPKNAFRAILFDHRNAISGYVIEASESGCVIHSETNSSDPLFVQKETACITLHDSRTGEGLKLKIRIAEITHEATGWTYRIRWSSAPAFLTRPQLSVAA